MMSVVVIRVVLIAALIVLAGLLSLAGLALTSARKALLRERASRGNREAATALALSERLKIVIPATRLGMVLAMTLVGVICGFWLADSTETGAETTGWTRFLGALGVLAISIALFVFAELLPRRLALQDPENFACRLAGPARAFSVAAGPVVELLSWGTEFLVRRFGSRPASRGRITHEEVLELIGDVTDGGALEPAEAEILKRAFRFCDRRARAIMTPRSDIVWIDLADTPDEVRRKLVGTPHSRFPVCDQSLDNLLGIVQAKDLLAQGSEGPTFRIKGHLTLPAFIFEGTRGPQILESLKKSLAHTAVVLDEYGSVVGLLTLNDILESVLGNMPERRGEAEEERIVERPDGSRSIDGRLPIDEFRELYDFSALPDGDYHTLAGLVVTQLGHIPRPFEFLDLQGLRLEVIEVNANRVVRVLVSAPDGAAGSS